MLKSKSHSTWTGRLFSVAAILTLVAAGFTSAQEATETNTTSTQEPAKSLRHQSSRQLEQDSKKQVQQVAPTIIPPGSPLPTPVPLSDIRQVDPSLADKLEAEQKGPSLANAPWHEGGDLVGYSILVMQGDTETIGAFSQANFSSTDRHDGNIHTWTEIDLDLDKLLEDAKGAEVLTNHPVIVGKIGTACRFSRGGEVPLVRGWIVDKQRKVQPVIEFETFGLDVKITPTQLVNGKLRSEFVIEESDWNGTEKTTVSTPDGNEFEIDEARIQYIRRFSAGYDLGKGHSMVAQYNIPETNRAMILVISPYSLQHATDSGE